MNRAAGVFSDGTLLFAIVLPFVLPPIALAGETRGYPGGSVVQPPIASMMSTRLLKVKKANWTATNGYGAVNTRCTVTGENTLRTMTLWKSQETLDENVDKIRALATRS